MKNHLIQLILKIPKDEIDVIGKVKEFLFEIGDVHSLLVRDTNDQYETYFRICDESKYNGVSVDTASIKVSEILKNPIESEIIGYYQSSIEILIEMYDPLIASLAMKAANNWSRFEYDDLYQTCRLCLCSLYSKGYYIHKTLLQRTFNNEVLQEARKHRNDPQIVSIDDVTINQKDSDGKKLTIADSLADIVAEEQKEEEDIIELEKSVYDEIVILLKEYLGERGAAKVIKDYTNKTTDAFSTNYILRFRKYLEKKGITLNYFLEKNGW